MTWSLFGVYLFVLTFFDNTFKFKFRKNEFVHELNLTFKKKRENSTQQSKYCFISYLS